MDGGEVELLAAEVALRHQPHHPQYVDTSASASNNGSKEVDGVEKEQQEAAAALSPQERSARLIITALSCVAFLLLGALGGIIGACVLAVGRSVGLAAWDMGVRVRPIQYQSTVCVAGCGAG